MMTSTMHTRTSGRIEQLRQLALVDGPQAMLVTSEPNVKYLTGFTGDSTWLLLTPDHAILISDTRFATQIEEECPGFEMEIRDSSGSNLDSLAKNVGAAKVSTLAVEAHAITKHQFDRIDEKLESVSLICTAGHVESLREIKDAFEIDEIRHAIGIAEQTFQVVRSSLSADQTEAHVAAVIEYQICMLGGYGNAFEPIVGVGPRSALPHAVKTDQRIGESPFVLIDWGARGRDYMSDLTRMLVTGKVPEKFELIYNTVLDAQLAAIKAIRPGVEMKEVDAVARKTIADAGFGDSFGHGLGHGFGLEIHESPRLAPTADGTLQAGMVVTVEPGIYLPGFGGVRIEDDIVVTPDGHEVLSSLPKRLEDAFVTL